VDINIKTSLQSYFVILGVFSPATIVVPVVLICQGKYIGSNFWPIHIILIVFVSVLLIYIYQEVQISKECIVLRKLSFFGTRTTKLYFNEVTSWSVERALILFIDSKEVMKINWVLFSRKDQEILINLFIASDINQD
jgi:hypothetical protein